MKKAISKPRKCTPRMIKCINTQRLNKTKDIVDLAREAEKNGFDGLELNIDHINEGKGQDRFCWKDIEKASRSIVSLTTNQFGLFDFAADDEPKRAESVDYFGNLQEIAAEIRETETDTENIFVAVSVSDIIPTGEKASRSYEETFHRIFDGLEPLVIRAEKLSVPLLFENPPRQVFLSPLELRDFIDKFSSAFLGLTFNPLHAKDLYRPSEGLKIFDRRVRALRMPLSVTDDENDRQISEEILSICEQYGKNIPILYR